MNDKTKAPPPPPITKQTDKYLWLLIGEHGQTGKNKRTVRCYQIHLAATECFEFMVDNENEDSLNEDKMDSVNQAKIDLN